jgi:imidazolonepropionase-like amidohydrolase
MKADSFFCGYLRNQRETLKKFFTNLMRLILLLFVTGISTIYAADTTRYVVLTVGKPSGKQLVWSNAPNNINYFFQYNDRGRGPKIKVTIQAKDGAVISRKTEGVDYFKGDASELFEITNGLAKWKNKIEEGQKQITGSVIYSPFNSAPGEIELSLQAALRSPHHEIESLPAGKLMVKHIKNHVSKIDGLPIELELYAFTGAGGPPSYLWFTPKHSFFASVSGWMTTIVEGHEELIPELKELQENLESAYFSQQAKTLTQKSANPIAITNVKVFHSRSGKVVSGQTVIIEEGKITQIGKAKKIKAPASARLIAGEGKMLLPGLWDNHAHYSKEQGLYHLAGGVTNIKDMANSLDLPETRKLVDNDELLGPEISIMSGFVDFAGPYAGPTGKIVKTLEEGIEGINYYADHSYDQIKLYSSIPPEWVKPLAAQAHKRGLKVVGHIPSYMTAERAVNDGYDQIIHLNMMMLNFLGDTLDTRSMGRFVKVAERAKDIDLNSPEAKRFFHLLKEKKIVVDPTAAIFENMFTDEPGKLAASYTTIADMFPAEFKRSLYYGGLPTMKGHEADYKKSYANMIKMLQLLYANGIPFVPGTDDFPGFALHRELELYAMAGVPNVEVLKKATLTSAEIAGKEKELGSIEIGKKANLILVDGDPTKNISDIRKVELTMKNGNLYDSKALYQSYGFGFWK